MKKLMLLTMSVLFAFSFSACSSKEDDSTKTDEKDTEVVEKEEEKKNTKEEEVAKDSLITWMMGGTFSYGYTMTSVGPEGTTEGSGSMAMDGNNMAITSIVTGAGQAVSSKVIIKDGVTYTIMDAEKAIMKMEGIGLEATFGMMNDYSSITKTSEGTGDINGKTLPYEEYTETTTGSIVRYYLDNGQVYGIESTAEGYTTTMIISNPMNSVPAGVFDLPVGYTEITM
jgi:hypothetical protein